ncbi:MAG: hypothetical protein ACI8WB_004632 [Phenylobacterium sp.]|jgi:hypothetical protein
MICCAGLFGDLCGRLDSFKEAQQATAGLFCDPLRGAKDISIYLIYTT